MIRLNDQIVIECRQWVIAFFICAVALQALPAEAKPLPGELAEKNRAVRLEPSSPWQLESLQDRCRLARQFDSSDGPGLVMIEQLAPTKGFDLTIAGPDIARSRKGSWFYAGMRSDLEMETIDPLEFDVAGYDAALALADVRIDDDKSGEAKDLQTVAAGIDIGSASKMERIVFQRSTAIVSFETGAMEAPFEALNECTRELLSGWGLDAEAHADYKPSELPNAKAYFSRLHHEHVNKPGNVGRESLLRVRTLVNSDGSVADCFHEFALSSGGAQPDVCEEVRQMQFESATDANGEPMASFYSASVFLSKFDPWEADAHGGR